MPLRPAARSVARPAIARPQGDNPAGAGTRQVFQALIDQPLLVVLGELTHVRAKPIAEKRPRIIG
jgi:hypothetical protein